MNVKFEGLDRILSKIDELGDRGNYVGAVGKACALVERDAKIGAPKDNGHLRRSITSKVEAEGDGITGTVYTPLEYAPYVEYGTGLFAEEGGRKDVPWHYKDDKGEWHSTSGQKPQPFIRPALNNNREKIVQLIKEGISND